MHLCRYLQIAGDLCFLIHCAYMESRGPESKAQVNGNEQNVKKMKKEFKIFSFQYGGEFTIHYTEYEALPQFELEGI